jgi:hypothetical protein
MFNVSHNSEEYIKRIYVYRYRNNYEYKHYSFEVDIVFDTESDDIKDILLGFSKIIYHINWDNNTQEELVSLLSNELSRVNLDEVEQLSTDILEEIRAVEQSESIAMY